MRRSWWMRLLDTGRGEWWPVRYRIDGARWWSWRGRQFGYRPPLSAQKEATDD